MLTAQAQQVKNSELIWLWFAMMVGPVAWSLHSLIGLILVSIGCGVGFNRFHVLGITGFQFLLLAFTVVMVLASAAGMVVGYRFWRRARRTIADGKNGRQARTEFMASMGVALSGLFLISILMTTIGLVRINSCTY
jgi:hypothetical protein